MDEANKNNLNPLLLFAEDVAELLNISSRQLYRLNSAGKIPLPIRTLGRPLWSRKELESWIDAGCVNRERWQEIKAASK